MSDFLEFAQLGVGGMALVLCLFVVVTIGRMLPSLFSSQSQLTMALVTLAQEFQAFDARLDELQQAHKAQTTKIGKEHAALARVAADVAASISVHEQHSQKRKTESAAQLETVQKAVNGLPRTLKAMTDQLNDIQESHDTNHAELTVQLEEIKRILNEIITQTTNTEDVEVVKAFALDVQHATEQVEKKEATPPSEPPSETERSA